MNIPVSVPPEKRSNPVKTISGPRGPSGVAVTDDGLVIVSERVGNCISLLDKEGKKIRSFGSQGSKRAQLHFPYGLALTSNRTILVADRKIIVFKSSQWRVNVYLVLVKKVKVLYSLMLLVVLL